MTAFQWVILILVVQLIHFLGTWKLYEKAGRKSWEAAIPIYNSIVLMKIINRPTWWTFLLFLPVINLIMFPVVWITTLKAFDKKTATDAILGVVSLGFYIYVINYNQNTQYVGNPKANADGSGSTAVGSILFAVVVATFIHTYFIQPFVIPSSSLEKSLLVGDFLFVSKFHYGARVPNTTVAAPMVHDTIPIIKTKSYLYDDANANSWKNKLQLPYFRFPGFQKIKNNDIVVFNWPRDTLYHMYESADRRYSKPTDKKTNYVKRCVGIAGDSLQIKDGFVYINGKKLELPERAKPQYNYNIYSKKGVPNYALNEVGCTEYYRCYEVAFNNNEQLEALKPYIVAGPQETDQVGKYKIYTRFEDISSDVISKNSIAIQEVLETQKNVPLTFEAAKILKENSAIDSVIREIKIGYEKEIFPNKHHDGANEKDYPWNGDNMGPIYIPKAGATVKLDTKVLPLYKTIITEYEGNKLQVKGNQIYINNKLANSYTFEQNYYWMMGDNRHRSLDARYFGYTPEDHIVGKPVFIWMSWDGNAKGIKNKIRWERLFTTVSGEGQPQSYFKYFLVLLGIYFIGEYFWNKRKENKV